MTEIKEPMPDFSDKFYHDIYVLAEIKRYSTDFTIRPESVAEHSFFVAAILFKLHEEYEFDLGKAMIMAISHDMPEIELNDVPRKLKRKYPAISEAFKEAEEDAIKEMPTGVKEAVELYRKNNCIETRMVHFADAIQCYQYASVEVKLGNTGYFGIVLSESVERISTFIGDLKYAKR